MEYLPIRACNVTGAPICAARTNFAGEDSHENNLDYACVNWNKCNETGKKDYNTDTLNVTFNCHWEEGLNITCDGNDDQCQDSSDGDWFYTYCGEFRLKGQ